MESFRFEENAEPFNSKPSAQDVFGRAGAWGSRGNFRGVATCKSSLFSHGTSAMASAKGPRRSAGVVYELQRMYLMMFGGGEMMCFVMSFMLFHELCWATVFGKHGSKRWFQYSKWRCNMKFSDRVMSIRPLSSEWTLTRSKQQDCIAAALQNLGHTFAAELWWAM